MAENYEEIVQGTIDEVKEAVEEQDLDLEELLEAEEENKNRVTLVEWLEERIADQTAEEFEEVVSEAKSRAGTEPEEEKGFFRKLIDTVTGKFFISGLAVGIVLTAAAFSLGITGSQALTPAEAGEHVANYFSDSSGDLPIDSVEVNQVEEIEGAGLYRASVTMTATVLNQSVEQDQDVIVTSSGRYLLLGQLVDTTRPLSEQVQQTTEPSG